MKSKNEKNMAHIFYVFSISSYGSASSSDAVYLFGGYSYTYGGAVTNIARYKDWQWEQIGNLNEPRINHAAIAHGNRVFVIGGWPGTYPTEYWDLDNANQTLAITEKPFLHNYFLPILFPVPDQYCYPIIPM